MKLEEQRLSPRGDENIGDLANYLNNRKLGFEQGVVEKYNGLGLMKAERNREKKR